MKAILHTLFVAITLCLVMASASCKKEKANTSCRLTRINRDVADSSDISYDAQNRVSRFGFSTCLYTFNYTGLTAQAHLSYYSDTSFNTLYNIYLNSDGRVASMTYHNTVAGALYLYTYNYQYDAQGRIVLCEQNLTEDASGIVTYHKDSLVFSSGNLVSKFSFTKTNTTPYVLAQRVNISYTAHANKIGYYVWGTDEEPTSLTSGFTPFFHLYGNTSENLPEKSSVYNNSGVLQMETIYTFLLNADGYPTDENLARTILSPHTYTRKFTYTCN